MSKFDTKAVSKPMNLRWRVSEETAAKLSAIRRDTGNTWDTLFIDLIRHYENKPEDLPPNHAARELGLVHLKMAGLETQLNGISKKLEEHGVVVQSLEPAIEQSNVLFGKLVSLLQLAYDISDEKKDVVKSTEDKPSRIQQFIKDRGRK
ncbi:MAG: hypothetical protein PHV34_19185 [Verrucomicrobiae bacterium]|nr:hypothetical protein [Verrucomicrobiae bacterium]